MEVEEGERVEEWRPLLGEVGGVDRRHHPHPPGQALHVSGLAFRVSGWCFGFRISGFGFRVTGFELQVSGLRFKASIFRFRVSDFGFRNCGLQVLGFGFSGLGFRNFGLRVWAGFWVPEALGPRFVDGRENDGQLPQQLRQVRLRCLSFQKTTTL